ncbi:hypothetical protein JCM8097_001524 [Rhodosporidiobolus ruineniae]
MSTPLVLGGGAVAVAASARWSSSVARLAHDYWTGAVALVGLCLLAYLTNPTPTSFRTHLTSQSFHTHLRRLSSSPASASRSPQPAGQAASSAPAGKDGSSTTSTTANGKRKASGSSTAAKQAASSSSSSSARHVLSFSNRISLSIKTPLYKFTSYQFFSTVFVPPVRPVAATAAQSGATKRQQQQLKKHPELGALLGLGGELWLGVFGKWYALKLWDNEAQEEEERRGRLEKSVKEMVVEDDERDGDYPNYSTAPSTTTASGSSTPAHVLPASSLDRSSSLSSHPDANVPPLSPTSKTSPAAARIAKRVFRAGQRRSSPTSLTRLKTKAEHAAREAAEAEKLAQDEAASNAESSSTAADGSGGAAAGGAGAGKAGVTDPILLELQAQLDELRATAADSERRLQDELEVLRGKKRDEDAFRAELKAKTKTLEEAKRLAEAARTEAEKELNERKGIVKEVQQRVDKLRDEIRALERKGLEVVERKEKKRRDRREREKKLRDDVVKKRDELKDKEKGLDDVLHKVGEMERKLDVRRALLASRRAELAQLAVAGVRGGIAGPPPPLAPQNASAPASAVNNGGGALYSIPPPSALPATATLGGVGAIANAFAVPFGQGAYGRRNYPYVHPLSANNSRPTSIRSGHFDPHTGAFQSAPSSPTISHPVSPHDDNLAAAAAPYLNNGADSASGWPSSFASVPAGTAPSAQQQQHAGFLEHRLQHRAAHSHDTSDGLPSHFLPFDFDNLASSGTNEPSPPLRSGRAGSLSGPDDPSPSGTSKPRAPPALPLQYLNSGLLATSSSALGGLGSPGLDTGPLSPMTPHQASLIPSQLFHMLDEDDDDVEGLYARPDSPTLRGAVDWRGLGLDVDDLGAGSRRGSGESGEGKSATLPPPISQQRKEGQPEKEEVEEQEEKDELEAADEVNHDSPVVVSPRAEGFSLAPGGASATSSPIGPPPASPFSPWDNPTVAPSSAAAASLDLPIGGSAILHRLSPSQDLDDDLPRAGLSLNPDAKAFAFPFVPAGLAGHARTSSVPSPPTVHAVAGAVGSGSSRTGRSATTSTLPSPTTLAPPVPSASTGSSAYGLVDPPQKSRMEFANRALDQPLNSARLSPGIDWLGSAASSGSSPKPAAAVAPIGTGPSRSSTPVPSAGAASAAQSSFNPFNPFDTEDDLLGPLKK